MKRTNGHLRPGCTGAALWVLLCWHASPAGADNPAFQDFFFSVCENPTGTLAQRCGETTDGLGNLSGDSESSLNPSQVLSNADVGLATARSLSKQVLERTERLTGPDSAGMGEKIDMGRFSLLVNLRSSREDQKKMVDQDRERGYESDYWAVELGADYRVSDRFVVGGLLAYEDSELKFDRENPGVNFTPSPLGAGEIKRDGISYTLFASVDMSERTYLSASAGYISSDFTSTRNVVFQESNRAIPQTDVTVRASYDGSEVWASFGLGYVGSIGSWTYGPYAGAIYSRSKTDAFLEEDLSDSGLAMAVDKYKRDSLLGQLGLRLTGSIPSGVGVFIPQFRVEYEHEFARDPKTARTAFQQDASGNVYRLAGDKPDRDAVNLAFGILGIFPNGWQPFFDYQVLLGNDDRDRYRLTLGLRKEL